MGTVLSNPWDLNFGLLAKRAETFEASSNQSSFTKRSSLDTNCDVAAYRGTFHVVKEVRQNPNPTNLPQIRNTCEPKAGNPDRNSQYDRTNKPDCKPIYFVYYTAPNQSFPSNPSYLFPVDDRMGRQWLDAEGITYNRRVGSNSSHSYYDDEADAEAVRDALVDHWNSMSSPSGCSDPNSLNYSPGAATGPCPCDSREPVFPDERYLGSSTGGWPAQTRNSTTYNNVNKATGDCSCIPKPSDGYILQQWSYQGMRDCGRSGVNPDYCYGGLGNSQRATEFWGWEEPEVSGKSSNRKQDGNFTYGYGEAPPFNFTYENKSLSVCPPDHICSSIDEEEFWTWEQGGAVKFKVTKCGGDCQKMGCMDEKAINYDPDAQIQPSQPSQPSANPYASLISENDKKILTQHQQDTELWKKYDCIYCDGDNETGKYDSDAGHCECVSGYSWINGKCQKSTSTIDNNEDDKPKKNKIGVGLVVGVLVAISLTGMALVSGGSKE